jgi:homoserine O-acetyltransferase/O-succinyltransferase
MKIILRFCLGLMIFLLSFEHAAFAYEQQKTGVWTLNNFQFHDGTQLPQLNIGFTTLGNPSNPAVLILHGTTGTGQGMLSPAFGGELFGDGQVLDAKKYFIILPDAIGMGQSSKPSDGLHARFPNYNYDDMVKAQYLLVHEGLGIQHLRLIMGNSMGGMHVWLWGIQYPNFADILVPMASSPIEISGRNWMLRRLITDSIRNDPTWLNGEYKQQPKSFQFASVYYSIASNGGSQNLQKLTPTREKADQYLNERLNAKLNADANDHLYQWEASRDFNPSADIEKIKAHVLVINSSDDERNPPELGAVEQAMKRNKNIEYFLIPASDQTQGHGTTGQAKWWKSKLKAVLEPNPHAN